MSNLHDNFIKLVLPKIILSHFVLLSNNTLGFIHLFTHLLDRMRDSSSSGWPHQGGIYILILTCRLKVEGCKMSITRENYTSQSAWSREASWTRWWLHWVLEEEWALLRVRWAKCCGWKGWHGQGHERQSGIIGMWESECLHLLRLP